MSKLLKTSIALVAILAALVVGLNIAVRSYLTQERIQAMVIPPAEKTLLRKVSLGQAKVSIFKGVIIKDLVVKEADGERDFLRIKEFALKYKLLPLIKKEFVITKIQLIEPYVRIHRDAAGHFNFESLGPMKNLKKETATSKGGEKRSLPLALTIEKIQVRRAHVVVQDDLKELPDTDLTANASLSLAMESNGAPSLSGDTDFTGHLLYGQVRSLVKGKASFTPKKLTYKATVETEGDTITFSGQVMNYMEQPSVILNISSPLLHLDGLMNLPKKLPKRESKGRKSGKKKATPPPKLEAKGEIKVNEALYKGLKAQAIQGTYQLKGGIFTLQQAKAKVAQGELEKSVRIDLNTPLPSCQGEATLKGIDMASLLATFAPKGTGVVTGTLDSHVAFSGRGIQWSTLKKRLSANGTFSLKKGGFLNFKAVNAIATLLKLNELKDMAFSELRGNFKVVQGKVLLKGTLNSQDVRAQIQGTVGLDGTLNLPVVLKLSPKLGDKLKKRVSFARYLSREKGWMVVPIKLTGSVDRPIPTPDLGTLKERLKGEATKALERLLPDETSGNNAQETPLKSLKGLFDR